MSDRENDARKVHSIAGRILRGRARLVSLERTGTEIVITVVDSVPARNGWLNKALRDKAGLWLQ